MFGSVATDVAIESGAERRLARARSGRSPHPDECLLFHFGCAKRTGSLRPILDRRRGQAAALNRDAAVSAILRAVGLNARQVKLVLVRLPALQMAQNQVLQDCRNHDAQPRQAVWPNSDLPSPQRDELSVVEIEEAVATPVGASHVASAGLKPRCI